MKTISTTIYIVILTLLNVARFDKTLATSGKYLLNINNFHEHTLH